MSVKAKPVSPNGTVAARGATLIDPERLLGLEFIRGTEGAALSAYKWMGKGDKESARKTIEEAIRYAESLPEPQRSDATIASLKKRLETM